MGSAAMVGALFFGMAPVASADQTRDNQWPLKAFDARRVWKDSTGAGVTVAVIDNGVNGDRPDLKGSVLPGTSLISGGGAANQEVQGNHGTAMTSIIAGHGHGPRGSDGIKGLAPDVKILPIKLYAGDEEGRGEGWQIAKAIRYAVDNGASVVNMSVGSYGSSEQERRAVAHALKRDVLLVAASGNSGTDTKQYPASYPGVFAVGAVDASAKIWRDSSYGPQVKLTAPGVDVYSAGNSVPYGITEGTSSATAYVPAAAALIRSKFPDLTAGQVANRLTKTALKPDGVEKLPDEHYGYGVIRPLRALTENIPAGSKYGPLDVPKADPADVEGSRDDASDAQTGADEGASPLLTAILAGGLLMMLAVIAVIAGFLALAVILIVVVVKKARRNGSPPGGPGGYGQPVAPGYPQQPPGPYQQQVTPHGSYPSGPYRRSAPQGPYPPGPQQDPPTGPYPPGPPPRL
ncbi:S8 family serine peptidase [Streptomyces meridianus]|uniref:S8 family serine peptidase n=1 Tax=Streptomyces meridianus TaxID=2938945 RepID=A0ABT0XDP3_9ACTN|nr:S8 family serine peptidase [Streptomyces meridianus]MCM2579842.1 S8 family serine peptidase [Streptomyces meridianus]